MGTIGLEHKPLKKIVVFRITMHNNLIVMDHQQLALVSSYSLWRMVGRAASKVHEMSPLSSAVLACKQKTSAASCFTCPHQGLTLVTSCFDSQFWCVFNCSCNHTYKYIYGESYLCCHVEAFGKHHKLWLNSELFLYSIIGWYSLALLNRTSIHKTIATVTLAIKEDLQAFMAGQNQFFCHTTIILSMLPKSKDTIKGNNFIKC